MNAYRFIPYLFICFFLVKVGLGQDQNCEEIIKKSGWNYSICLDSTLDFVDEDGQQLVVTSRWSEQFPFSREVRIGKDFNYDKLSGEKIWKTQVEPTLKIDGNLVLNENTSLKINGNTFFINRRHIEYEGDTLAFLTALTTYKSNFIVFMSAGISGKSTSPNQTLDAYDQFLKEVLKRSTFYGEPLVKDDRPLKKDFLDTFCKGIKDTTVLRSILMTTDLMIKTDPTVPQEKIEQELPSMTVMVGMMNAKTVFIANELGKYNDLKLTHSDFSIVGTTASALMYEGFLTFASKEKPEIKIKALTFILDGKMYLGRLAKN